MSGTLYLVSIEPLDSGFVITREDWAADKHRTAEPTLQGALTLAARALGYRGVIRFDDERTVEVPVVGVGRVIPTAEAMAAVDAYVERGGFDAAVKRAVEEMKHVPGMYDLPKGPILTQAYGLGPGPAVDDEEPPLRAGTAIKPDDLV